MKTKYTKEILEEAVNKSDSFRGVLRLLGKSEYGGMVTFIKERIVFYNIDYSHFVGKRHTRGKPSKFKKLGEEGLILKQDGARRTKALKLRNRLADCGIEEVCAVCKIGPEWNGHFLRLEVDHINENKIDDRLNNLQFLCPNCHSQKTLRKHAVDG